MILRFDGIQARFPELWKGLQARVKLCYLEFLLGGSGTYLVPGLMYARTYVRLMNFVACHLVCTHRLGRSAVPLW